MLAKTIASRVRAPLAARFSSVALPNTNAYIGGEWVSAQNSFVTLDPSTEEKIADVTNCGAAEVDRAVAAAHSAFYGGEYSQLSGYERGRLLNKLADLMEANHQELAVLESLDNGKPLGESRDIDIPLAIQCYRYYAGWADKISGTVVNPGGPIAKGAFGYIEKEPVGIVGQIIPWNFPLLMQAWKLAPAIAAGCAVVLKTAPQTPLTANRIAELVHEAGFPKGAINVIPGGDETGKLLVNHDGVDKIAFTGSTEVGHRILESTARSHNMKRVTLELGGKSPALVTDDCDMETAVNVTQLGLFLNQGQCCCASSRIFVHEKVYDEFVEKSAAAANARTNKAGLYCDEAAFSKYTGPQVDKEQQDKIMGFIQSGKAEGATCVAGGEVGGDKGFFVQPTVFADCKDDMKIVKEEIFGPVMQILKYSDDSEALARANNSNYGLAAAVFSKDFVRARGLAKGLRAGTVWINTYDCFDAALPFGGVKASGLGRELGAEGLNSYLETKTMVVGM